ncbi:MAG: transcription antitermination factor NusB [Gammaproteobacteria bacterium]|nr:transcription antitermination factor NusB [Gammaproteobacteria bacterium]MCP5424007.1 transcription antitermination factor NusB [Gammaproteobacteria bacterium]
MNGIPPRKGFTRGRSWARRYAMQALYQWQMTGQDAAAIFDQFLSEQEMGRADLTYFQELLCQIPLRVTAIDAQLVPFLDRPLEQVDPVERAILRIAAYELAYRPDVPFRVVINEAVEIAKKFGAEQGHRFVNGVLDKTARQLRPQEGGHA